LRSDFSLKALQEPDSAICEGAEKPKRGSKIPGLLAIPSPYPLPYPSPARITKASAKTNNLFALYRGFYRA
jgi:hypothetical protein